MDIPSLSWYLEELDLGEHDIALGPHFLSITEVKNWYLPKSVVPVRFVVTMIFYSVKLVPVYSLKDSSVMNVIKLGSTAEKIVPSGNCCIWAYHHCRIVP